MTTKSYIWLGERREWMSVTGAGLVERCSMKMGWRGEEGKERLQERGEVEEVVEVKEMGVGEFPLQRAR